MARQNTRSKANPGRDGKPRSTEPKGFKKRTTGIGSRPTGRVADFVVGDEIEVDLHAQAEALVPRRPYTAAGFTRAVDLSALAEPEPQVEQQPEGPLAPGDWKIQAMVLADGACAVTGDVAPHWHSKEWDVHHIIPKGLLKDQNLHAWVWDLRNALVLTEEVHAWFSDPTDRCIPREVLSPSIWVFANELDEHLRSSWATEYVLNHYPLVGPLRLAELRTTRPPME